MEWRNLMRYRTIIKQGAKVAQWQSKGKTKYKIIRYSEKSPKRALEYLTSIIDLENLLQWSFMEKPSIMWIQTRYDELFSKSQCWSSLLITISCYIILQYQVSDCSESFSLLWSSIGKIFQRRRVLRREENGIKTYHEELVPQFLLEELHKDEGSLDSPWFSSHSWL